MSYVLEGSRQQLFRGITDDVAEPCVDPQPGPIRAHLSEADRGVVERRIEPRLSVAHRYGFPFQPGLVFAQKSHGLFEAGNVPDDLGGPNGFAECVPNGRDSYCDVNRTAVFVKPDGLNLFDTLSGRDPGEKIVLLLLALRWNDAADGLPQHFFFAVAEELGRRLIPACHCSIEGLADDGIKGRAYNCREEGGSVLSLCLHRDIVRLTRHAGKDSRSDKTLVAA